MEERRPFQEWPSVDIAALLKRRARFVREECRRRGWPLDPQELSLQQALEIRNMPGWENPK